MKRNRTLFAAMALALSASPLFAQENQPNPPQRPPQPAQGEGGSRREGAPGGGGQRPMPGIFTELDANHDGAIDNEELAHAADVLRKFDRNGDGRITPDEMRPPGDGQRPQAVGAEQRGPREGEPQAPDGEQRGPRAEGPRDQGPRAEGPKEQGPRGEARGDGERRQEFRRDGDRPQGPGGEVRRDGERPRGPAPEGPRASGPRDGERPDNLRREGERGRGPGAEGPREQRGPGDGPRQEGPQPRREGDARRDGPQGSPSGEQPQARRHQGPPAGPSGDRFARREPRPDFGRDNPRAPWDREARREAGAPRGPLAMGPGPGDRRGPGHPPERDGSDQREFRHELGARGPQGGLGQFRPPTPPGPGFDRQGPPRMERPNFGPPPGGPRGPGELRRPEGPQGGRENFGPPPRGDHEPRSPGPWQHEVQ